MYEYGSAEELKEREILGRILYYCVTLGAALYAFILCNIDESDFMIAIPSAMLLFYTAQLFPDRLGKSWSDSTQLWYPRIHHCICGFMLGPLTLLLTMLSGFIVCAVVFALFVPKC